MPRIRLIRDDVDTIHGPCKAEGWEVDTTHEEARRLIDRGEAILLDPPAQPTLPSRPFPTVTGTQKARMVR